MANPSRFVFRPRRNRFWGAVLSNAASATLAEQSAAEYLSILDSLTRNLRQCFVWSLSQEANNDFLKANYSGDHGAILKLPSNFSHTVRSGWHLTPTGDGYSANYACDLYDQLEGFVVYDPTEQDEIAKLACNAYASLNAVLNTYDKLQRIITAHHLRTALTQCLILFKKPCFLEEKEYTGWPWSQNIQGTISLNINAEIRERTFHTLNYGYQSRRFKR